jgi:putative inorganic carbon (HCO3(-)) transporter
MKEKAYKFFDQAFEYSLYGLIFSIPISKAAVASFSGFLLLFFIIKKILKPDFSFLKDRSNIFLLLFVVFCALSILNSGPYAAKSFWALFLKWLKYIGIFLLVQDALSEPKRIERAVSNILFVAGLIALDAILQRFSGRDLMRGKELVQLINGMPAVTGPFNHYNDLASYLIVVIALLIAILVSNRLTKLSQLTLTLLGIFLGASLILTFSRGAWIGFVLSLFLMLFLSRNYIKIIPLIVISTLFLLFLPGVRERFAFTFQDTGDADRLIVWGAALRMISENPFLGKGIGTFMDYFHAYVPNLYVQYAHNCFLQIWAETGIFSLLSFLFFVGAILYKGAQGFKKTSSPILLGLICALFGFLVHSFFDTQLYSLQLAYLFWVILGVTVAVTRQELSGSK